MAMMTEIASLGRARVRGHNHSAWRNFWDEVLEPRALSVEDEIIEYLHCYRHDLPPEVWLEFERCGPRS
jgi:hypothetical protein